MGLLVVDAMLSSDVSHPLDSQGKPITIGVTVRLTRLPDWLIHDLPPEDVAWMRKVEGEVLRVSEIDPHGYVWIADADGDSWFCVKSSDLLVV